MEISVTKKNVHSKVLFNTIDDHVRAVVMLLDISSDMEGMVSLIEMLLEEEVENYKLEQINVISDGRNNKISDLKTGKFIVDIYYRHKNCFNTTQLIYTLQK